MLLSIILEMLLVLCQLPIVYVYSCVGQLLVPCLCLVVQLQ